MDNYSSIINKVKKLAWQKLKNESSGHDFWHCYRVVKNALNIGKKEQADLLVLELAGWLHDIGCVSSRDNHELVSAKLARKYLTGLNLLPNIIEKITGCIEKHRFSKKKKAINLEEEIIQDADKLDALGAIGIARAFYGGPFFKEIFHNPSLKPDSDYYLKTGKSTSVVNHFYEKLFQLPKLLHRKAAREIAEKRVKIMKEFLKNFYLEWEGKK